MLRPWIPALILFAISCANVLGQTISITGPDRYAVLEGETYPITWASGGLQSVSVVAYGTRTPLGERSRGDFAVVIAEAVPAEQGEVQWTVPWIDSKDLFIKLKGYNSQGLLVTVAERGYGFRPLVMANRTADGIYLDLHKRTDQRLYVQKDYRITRAYLSSSSENYLWMPPDRHINKPHDHTGAFKVLEKTPLHQSRLFHVPMPWAMRYHGGHFIHATSSSLYRYLGRAASHGCNRLTRYDAHLLYESTPIGTRVEVIGPNS